MKRYIFIISLVGLFNSFMINAVHGEPGHEESGSSSEVNALAQKAEEAKRREKEKAKKISKDGMRPRSGNSIKPDTTSTTTRRPSTGKKPSSDKDDEDEASKDGFRKIDDDEDGRSFDPSDEDEELDPNFLGEDFKRMFGKETREATLEEVAEEFGLDPFVIREAPTLDLSPDAVDEVARGEVVAADVLSGVDEAIDVVGENSSEAKTLVSLKKKLASKTSLRGLRIGWKEFSKKLKEMSSYLDKNGLKAAVLSARNKTCFVIKMGDRIVKTLLTPALFPARLVMDAGRYGLNAKGVWTMYSELAFRTGNMRLYGEIASFARKEAQYSKTLFKDGYKKYLKDLLNRFNPLKPL